jgi:hypothetical protein
MDRKLEEEFGVEAIGRRDMCVGGELAGSVGRGSCWASIIMTKYRKMDLESAESESRGTGVT